MPYENLIKETSPKIYKDLRYNSDPSSKRREGGGFNISMVSVDVIEHVDGFTIRVAADDDVFDVVDDTGKLKNCRLSSNSVL